MGMDKQKLLGQKSLSAFEARWLADRNVDHPALRDMDVPEPGDVDGDSDVAAPDFGTDETDQLPPYEAMSHADLKADAASRGLAQSGSKADLIQRLEAHDAENAE